MKHASRSIAVSIVLGFPGRVLKFIAGVSGVILLSIGWAPSALAFSNSTDVAVRPLLVNQTVSKRVVLKWQARSSSSEGEWRVYSSIDGRHFELADTIPVAEGIQHYSFSDLRMRADLPTQVYQLRYHGDDGRETVVAVARCTGAGLENLPATPSNHDNPTADVVSAGLNHPYSSVRFPSSAAPKSWQWIPQPEVPPPRGA